MTDSPRATQDDPSGRAHREPSPSSPSGWRPRLPVLAQLLASAAVAGLIFARHPSGPLEMLELSLAGLAIMSATLALVRPSPLERRLGELHRLLLDVRDGREPLESVSHFNCPRSLIGLATVCHDMARELRIERARVKQLEGEVRQRVANRTEALERKIGALRQQAEKDALTGLLNRRALDAYLPDAIERSRASGGELCVLTIDIDHFKPLNDALGHAAGDQMLRSVAQLIRSTLRESDSAFRNGGDEFVVVLEECGVAGARSIAQRIDSLGASLGRTFRLMPPPSLSVGITMLADLKDADATRLLRKADEALYRVKAAHHAVPPDGRGARKSA